MMVTGVLADRKPVELHLFRNYPSPSELVAAPYELTGNYATPPPPQEQLVWKAARASGAAPSYFRSVNQSSDQRIQTFKDKFKSGFRAFGTKLFGRKGVWHPLLLNATQSTQLEPLNLFPLFLFLNVHWVSVVWLLEPRFIDQASENALNTGFLRGNSFKFKLQGAQEDT